MSRRSALVAAFVATAVVAGIPAALATTAYAVLVAAAITIARRTPA